jgi:hypothetical protein
MDIKKIIEKFNKLSQKEVDKLYDEAVLKPQRELEEKGKKLRFLPRLKYLLNQISDKESVYFGGVSDDDLEYSYEKLGLTKRNYKNYETMFQYIQHQCDKLKLWNDCSGMFSDYRVYFKYEKQKFIFRLLIGQGSCLQIITDFIEDWPSEKNPMMWQKEKAIDIKTIIKK